MAKPRTPVQLIAVLDRELSWRRTDLVFALRLVQRSGGSEVDSAVRAAVPLLYAHWEGFVKKAACHYGDFLSAQRLRFGDVVLSLSGMRAQSYVSSLGDIKKRIYAASELLQSIREIEDERVSISVSSHIDRMGNLNHDMLMQIVKFFDLPSHKYETLGPLLDEALLNHRNKIAHGEFLDVGPGRYESMHRDIVHLLEQFKADVEDAAVTKSYRRAA